LTPIGRVIAFPVTEAAHQAYVRLGNGNPECQGYRPDPNRVVWKYGKGTGGTTAVVLMD